MTNTATKEHSFKIKTEVFEGPMELLLDLVEKRKLLINDISLASVTDDYISAVSQMQEKSLPGTANFVALAATLLLIKSKSLLPVLELTEEESESIDDLENRLMLYQIYRDAGKNILSNFGKSIMYEKNYTPRKTIVFIPDKYCSHQELREAIIRVIKELPFEQPKPKVNIRKVVSLEEMMSKLQQRIERQIKLKFSELIGNDKEKTTIIVGFLAILESFKQGSILVAQLGHFADIEIEQKSTKMPDYR